MGTRHLIAVQSEGEYKIAQYGQWDGYPSGQGTTVLSFLSEEGNIAKLKDALNKCRFIEDEGRDKEFIESYNKNTPEWSNDPDNRTEAQRHWFESYCTRDLGGKILESVAKSEDDEILLRDNITFAHDSLFCEYAYVIDFDTNTFEVFEGFNESPLTEGRFVTDDSKVERLKDDHDRKYHPVKLLKSYSLSELPTEEQFLEDLKPVEEEA